MLFLVSFVCCLHYSAPYCTIDLFHYTISLKIILHEQKQYLNLKWVLFHQGSYVSKLSLLSSQPCWRGTHALPADLRGNRAEWEPLRLWWWPRRGLVRDIPALSGPCLQSCRPAPTASPLTELCLRPPNSEAQLEFLEYTGNVVNSLYKIME